eukprot:gnl/MRDRNA2_/MRDRNA2_57950_c0_seq1.p1 gnl/MRDRNA2_/MRDRNA2_57950_c0~~gnl/MRDRNA2_/MRDRNA2_57950_c0_seq1.p1  ORF type:complete len:112 (+),score=9.99 gnl/MRDRNA2_/MRDRNA2_57950_c0_seq1:283-618(+)
MELVLIVAITTNFVQFTWSRCSTRPKGYLGHFSRFAPFYAALVSTPLLCFPKADVVVGDLLPSTASFTNLEWPIQVSAVSGAVCMAAAAILLSRAPLEDKKANPLLPTNGS